PTTSNITVTDTAGNTYTKDADVTNTGNVRTLLFSAPVTAAIVDNAGSEITVNFPATTPFAKAVKFFSVPGLVTASPADKSATATGTGDSASVGPTATTTQADELVVAVFG